MNPQETKHSAAIGPGCAGPSVNLPQESLIVRPHRAQAQYPLCGGEAFAVNPTDVPNVGGDPRKHTQCASQRLCSCGPLLQSHRAAAEQGAGAGIRT